MLKTMKLGYGILLPFFVVAFSSVTFSQTEVHSGILHTQSSVEEYNLIKIHCDGVSSTAVIRSVSDELKKYPKEIYSFDFDQVNHKIYVKYKGAMSPNMILGILDRVNIRAYYLVSGSPVYFVKTGNEIFVR